MRVGGRGCRPHDARSTRLLSRRAAHACAFVRQRERGKRRCDVAHRPTQARAARGVCGHTRTRTHAPRRVEAPLEDTCSQAELASAICVQDFDDSLNSAIRIKYHVSLRSSSLREPRYPSARVVCVFFCFSLCTSRGMRCTLSRATTRRGEERTHARARSRGRREERPRVRAAALVLLVPPQARTAGAHSRLDRKSVV